MTEEYNNEGLVCIGCGAAIQHEHPDKAGFLPQSVLKKRDPEEGLYCKRCFRLRHYNEVHDVELTDDDFLNMLHELNQEDALIVNMVDIFDFNGSVITGIQRFAGNNPILFVANKTDLLPKSLKHGKLKQWITEQAHSMGIRPKNVHLISALSRRSVEDFMQMLEKEREGKSVYIVGTTNVGKSTLVNQIIKIATESEEVITTSYFPGTTLGKIEIPLDDETVLVDTPGIIQNTQLSYYLNPVELKTVTPRKEVKPRGYQLNEQQTVFFGGLARFDYISGGGNQPFIFYAANELNLHRTKTEKADDLYEKHLGELLTPPFEEHSKAFPKLKRYEFVTKGPSDIVFSGLGWVSVDKANIKVAGWVPAGVDVVIRKQLI